jgi:probable HAF family extracellular repeat protein
MRTLQTALLLGLMMTVGVATRSAAAESYVLGDLGTFGAKALNDAGQVAGSADHPAGGTRAVLWDSALGVRDLGTLGGSYSYGRAINNAGQVVGGSAIPLGPTRAFRWDPRTQTMQNLGTLGGNGSDACGINDAGHVVGYASTALNESHAALWDDEGIHDLGTLGASQGQSIAWAINNAGQVVGSASTAGTNGQPYGLPHAFLWDPGTRRMQDLGTLPGTLPEMNSTALAINNKGQVVGYSTTATGRWHAFLWDSTGGMRDLGTLGGGYSMAYGINDAGQVVGVATGAEVGGGGYGFVQEVEHAFLWDPSTQQMQDLGTLIGGRYSISSDISTLPGGGFHSPVDINNQGQILGTAAALIVGADGTEQAVVRASLATPNAANTPAGADVEVQPISTAAVSFPSVESAGSTTVSPIPPTASLLPANFQLPGAAFYEIHTTATFTGPVRVSLRYDPARFPDGQNVRMLHYDDGLWEDITISIDTVNHVVHGEARSFSPFAVAQRGYSWSGVLQPVNADGSSVFKLGSTVPVKFQLTGASAGITGLAPRLYLAPLSGSVVGSELEAGSTSAPDSGNTFRYTGGQYLFNLGTRTLAQGSYLLRIDLGDDVVATRENGRLVVISFRN